MRRLDIGISSYRNPEKLKRCLESVAAMSTTDWRCLIVHNSSGDVEGGDAYRVAENMQADDRRFIFDPAGANLGYAASVNRIAQWAETPYFAYLDNDIEILTPGWDERLCAVMDLDPRIRQVFPGEGHYGFRNGKYHECLWGVGCAWVIRAEAALKLTADNRKSCPLDFMDTSLGHHEEVDLMVRLRLAGYRLACDPGVNILHHQTATSSPESAKRIHMGVVRFMNKWERYFVGDSVKHPNPDPDSGEGYDPAFLRYTDWPPCALYLERWVLSQFSDLNANPETVQTTAGPMDVIKILKPTNCYRGRAI